jgi:palmitoyltransferase
MSKPSGPNPKVVILTSRFSAVFIPLIEAGVVGYATWVVTVLLCLDYLLHPNRELRDAGIYPRNAAAIAILVVYFFLLLIMAVVYLRLIQVIWTNPGYIPFGSAEKGTDCERYFERHEAFITDHQGNPIWCEKCNNYKPDRTHHCSQTGRCVRRMDHFCPWAGGIVSETNHKFFLQFLFYGTIYCAFTTIVFAVYSAERRRKLGHLPGTWIALLGLAGIFLLFVLGMVCTTFHQAAKNLTTVESLDHKFKTYQIAVRTSTNTAPPNPPVPSTPSTPSTPPSQLPPSPPPGIVILQTAYGDNPWDLGVKENLKQLMGEKWWDWFLPFKMSPCTRHDDPAGHYRWGPVLERLKKEAGIVVEQPPNARRRSRRSRSSKSAVTG